MQDVATAAAFHSSLELRQKQAREAGGRAGSPSFYVESGDGSADCGNSEGEEDCLRPPACNCKRCSAAQLVQASEPDSNVGLREFSTKPHGDLTQPARLARGRTARG